MKVPFNDHLYSFAPWKPSQDQVFTSAYALDTETTLIDKERNWRTPAYVLGAVFDGEAGYFLQRKDVEAFLIAHDNVSMVCHNAAFDLAVVQLVTRKVDVYDLVEHNRVWDTQLLHRLYVLGKEGHAARGKDQATLDHCAEQYLDARLPKDVKDSKDNDIRLSWAKWLNKPVKEIEPVYLEYLAKDAIATLLIFDALKQRIHALLKKSSKVWGFVSETWLREQALRFGPLTHHIQLRAAVVLREVSANGLHLDTQRKEGLARNLNQSLDKQRQQLRKQGYLAGGDGSNKSLQAVLSRLARRHPELHFPHTETGMFGTSHDALFDVAPHVPFIQQLMEYRETEKLLNSFVGKMARPVLHPSFDVLARSGRTSSFGEINAQNLPKRDEVRACFIPTPGRVFIDADYKTIELATLAQANIGQFQLESKMAEAINADKDLHRLVAAHMLGKDEDEITKAERNKVKPINFGKPGGMGIETLLSYAKCNYGIHLTRQEAEELSEAWLRLFPEMEEFLKDTVDVPYKLAKLLGLTPSSHFNHTGDERFLVHPENAGRKDKPHRILGMMCIKILKQSEPQTSKGKAYSNADIDYFWSSLERRIDLLPNKLQREALERRPSRALQRAVMSVAGSAGVFTFSGRIRAKATYSARHNTVFQGLAADGAKIALWELWRAGFRIVNFVHDQVLVEVPAESDLKEQAERIRTLMIAGMKEVVPDVLVDVSFAAADRWHKDAVAVWSKKGKELMLWHPDEGENT
jgi:DNA polymerase I-like protein with 3'-5' exonuclease and polymerase domains